MAIRAYLMAVDGIPYPAVARAGQAYIQGRVQGHNRAFAPSCAEFADQCRYQQLAIENEHRIQNAVKIEDKRDEAPRVSREKMKLLQRHMNGDRTATEALKRMFPDNEMIARAVTRSDEQEERQAEA